MAEVLSKNTSKSFFETRIQTAPPRGASVLEGIVCHRMALRLYGVTYSRASPRLDVEEFLI